MDKPGIRIAPIPARWRRLALIGGGLLVFFWLRLEDHGVLVALLMGLVVAGLALAFWLWPRLAGRPWSPSALVFVLALAGTAYGLLTALSAALLMLLKNGFHGHLNPDYPAGLIGDTLARAPAWGLVGALLGTAVALLLIARNR